MLAHRLLTTAELNVPTIVLLTDRIDLDDQLFKTFFSARDYLKCEPVVATSREDLVKKLSKINILRNKIALTYVVATLCHKLSYGILLIC